MKKKLSALLALVLITGCLTACGSSGPEATAAPESTPEASAGPETTPVPVSDSEPDRYDLAFAQYEPDEVVMTINGDEVTWAEYFYWIYSIAYQVQQMSEVDWSADLDGTYTYQSYAQNYADTMLTQYLVVAQKAEELGLEISAEQQGEIDAILAEDVANYAGGDKTAFEQYLSERFIPRAMYDKMNAVSVCYLNLFEHYFGVMGENLPDADAQSYAADSGYMHAKHILIRTVDDTGAALAEAEIEAARVKAEELLGQLKGLSGEALEEKFDELMNSSSEDGGLATAPDGYYFVPGDMVAPFENAVLALDDGEMSPELVESQFGYHIVLRLPLDIDQAMDSSGYTLRYIAASALFSNMSAEWFDSAEVVYKDKFTTLDFNELFGSAPETTSSPDSTPVPEATPAA